MQVPCNHKGVAVYTWLSPLFVCVRSAYRLVNNERGVVSFEYIIVAACIIGAVAAAFGTGAGGAIGQALAGGITTITTAFTAAV